MILSVCLSVSLSLSLFTVGILEASTCQHGIHFTSCNNVIQYKGRLDNLPYGCARPPARPRMFVYVCVCDITITMPCLVGACYWYICQCPFQWQLIKYSHCKSTYQQHYSHHHHQDLLTLQNPLILFLSFFLSSSVPTGHLDGTQYPYRADQCCC